jgi:proteasome lid subunit RPN8/RPN11
VSDEIEFGEVEEAAPQRALRPDENHRFAVGCYAEPSDFDLPIYIDLDVLLDMEQHAGSDTSVELGGVLLGGRFQDEQGRPFVVVSDCLRAEHYESTKGSFKFTHETWSAITRDRQRLAPDLEMIGWYHTHPGWGVFLSGMDMFICDHFFNKSLDIAYVIDPCRGDRGMFQWTGETERQVRRTGGFFVTASRFRAAELEDSIAELSGNMPATSSRPVSGASSAPIVHLHQPRDQQPSWQVPAVLGMLALQFLLVALIALKTLVPMNAVGSTSDEKIAGTLKKLDDWLDSSESRGQVQLAWERAKAQSELLDQVLHELKGTDEGLVTRLTEKLDQTNKLVDDVAARDAQIREQRSVVEDVRSRLQALETKSKSEKEALASQVAKLTSDNERLRTELDKKKTEINPATAASSAPASDSNTSIWWWAGGAVLVGLLVIAGVWWIGGQEHHETATENSPSSKTSES